MNYNLFLIGFMGVGKSTIARELEQLLGFERIEMDAAIEADQGMIITQIFSEKGEEYFRDLESRFLAGMQAYEKTVVSCGGGVVLRTENRGLMKKSGRVIWLSATPEEVYNRVKDSDERPILNGNMNVGYIAQLMEARREKYEAAADIIIHTDHKDKAEICQEIIEALRDFK